MNKAQIIITRIKILVFILILRPVESYTQPHLVLHEVVLWALMKADHEKKGILAI